MRNFSTKVPSGHVIGVFSSQAVQSFPKLVRILLNAMGAQSIDALTPSQKRCVIDLNEWLISIQDTDFLVNPASNPAYTYNNVYTGEIYVFVVWYGYAEYGIKLM